MQRMWHGAFCGFVLLSIGWLSSGLSLTSAQAPVGNIAQWEYETQRRDDEGVFSDQLNLMGKDGWELVTINFTPKGQSIFVFKRPKP